MLEWKDPPPDRPHPVRALTVECGTLGPVLRCPVCDWQGGYLADRVTIGVLLADARRHLENAAHE
jgi:hypothetical protein